MFSRQRIVKIHILRHQQRFVGASQLNCGRRPGGARIWSASVDQIL